MSELPYMPVNVNDEIAETAHLTNEELGALMRLKWALWKSGGYLADDGKQIARIARAGSRWGKIAPAVLALLTVAGGMVSSRSMLTTLLITRERRAKAVKAVNVRNRKPEVPLNSNNLLKTHKVGIAQEASKQLLGAYNHNQKKESKDFKTLLEPSAAAVCGSAQGHSSKASAGSVEGLARSSGDEDLNLSLYVHGTELVVTRTGVNALQARAQISRWLMQIPDGHGLARVLADVDQHNLQGAAFINVVDQRVAEIAAEAVFGSKLPFGATAVGRKAGSS